MCVNLFVLKSKADFFVYVVLEILRVYHVRYTYYYCYEFI